MDCLNWAHACTQCEVSPVLRDCNSVGKKIMQSQRQWLDAESWGPSSRALLGKRGCLSSFKSSWQSHQCRADVQILAGAITSQSRPVASSAQPNQKFWRKYPSCMDINSAWGVKPASLNLDFPKYCQHFIPLPSSYSYEAFWQPFKYVLTCRVKAPFCALNTTTKCWHISNLVYIFNIFQLELMSLGMY